jgi:pimeloyl-ACP methyl ester carboxylesterase
MKRECHVRFCEGGGVKSPSATRLVELGRDLHWEDAIFVGHSCSAMIGTLASIRAPGMFDGLILMVYSRYFPRSRCASSGSLPRARAGARSLGGHSAVLGGDESLRSRLTAPIAAIAARFRATDLFRGVPAARAGRCAHDACHCECDAAAVGDYRGLGAVATHSRRSRPRTRQRIDSSHVQARAAAPMVTSRWRKSRRLPLREQHE